MRVAAVERRPTASALQKPASAGLSEQFGTFAQVHLDTARFGAASQARPPKGIRHFESCIFRKFFARSTSRVWHYAFFRPQPSKRRAIWPPFRRWPTLFSPGGGRVRKPGVESIPAAGRRCVGVPESDPHPEQGHSPCLGGEGPTRFRTNRHGKDSGVRATDLTAPERRPEARPHSRPRSRSHEGACSADR